MNLGNIYGAISQVAQRINFLHNEENGLSILIRLLKSIRGKLDDTNNEIKLLNTQYVEVIKRIVPGNETLVQDIGNFLN